MKGNYKALALVVGVALGAFGTATQALAADLPKSGSFDLQTGLKGIGEATQVAEKHILAAGKFWGVSFNTSGSGPLHMSPAVCTYASEVIETAGTVRGNCAWTDPDGDGIFSEFSGHFTAMVGGSGLSTITSGTGKYSGIQGKGPYTCKTLNANGQSICTQHFDYQLTAEATGTSTASPAK
jgi:hypothetical protein